MVQEAPQTRESDFASRAMTVICCFAVLITVTAIGSDEVPQPGVRNAINLLGGKRKHANFDRAMPRPTLRYLIGSLQVVRNWRAATY